MSSMRNRYHGSHPGHAFDYASPRSQQCSICRAASDGSSVEWYACCEPGCHHLLCGKCFDVEERLFDSVQVVIRNPLVPHDEGAAAVYTRPRPNSYKLAPIYACKLMEVVSSAVCLEDSSQTYFRLKSGGWINSCYVVCVIPAEGYIEHLARLHMASSSPAESPLVSIGQQAFADIMLEGMRLVSDNPPYGVVMSALTMYPILKTVGVPLPGADDAEAEGGKKPMTHRLIHLEERAVFVDDVVRFLHVLLHHALSELECTLDDDIHIDEGTMISLYTDVLADAVRAAHDLQQQWRVGLPEEFVQLLLRACTMFGRLHALLSARAEGPHSEVVRMGLPAVITNHVDVVTEFRRLRQVCSFMTDMGTSVLLSLDPTYALRVSSLQRMREQLVYSPFESLEKTFCDLLAACLLRKRGARREFLDVDPLEVIYRLCKTNTLAVSQISVFRVVSLAARQCPRNIAVISSVVLSQLLSMAKTPRSTAVLTVALDCFRELAYNDPVGEEEGWPYTTPHRPASAAAVTCTHHRHPGCAPFQRMHVFQLSSGMSVALCSGCAEHHPPLTAVSAGDREYAYFRCQCTSCCHDSAAQTQTLPAPTVPPTLALQSMISGGVFSLLTHSIAAHSDNAALLNAAGRLALRLPVPDDVIRALYWAVTQHRDISRCADAALAVAVHAYRPIMAEFLRTHSDGTFARYVEEPYVGATPQKGSTPASSSHTRSELGLSPSPHGGSSAFRSSNEYMYSSAMSSQPAVNVNLFAAASMSNAV